jgi:hypothetical protein
VNEVRPYSNKFSKRKFTQRQHLALLMLKERLQKTYREIVQLLELMPELLKLLGLKEVPHFTTLQKFFARVPRAIFDSLLRRTLAFFRQGEILSIDASGFSISRMSSHYEKRCYKNRHYIKSSLAIDACSQAIVADKVRKSRAHEVRDFKPLLHKSRGYATVVADKGYDAEMCHRDAIKSSMRAIIPVRKRGRSRVMGRNRARMATGFDEATYHQRSKSETVFSVIKRKFKSDLCSRSTRLQKREVRLLNVCYNIYKAAALLLRRISTELFMYLFLLFYHAKKI